MNERIREVRKALGLTLEKFGANLGVTKTAICDIERGRRNVTNQMLTSVCKTYHVNETWIRTGEGEKFSYITNADKIRCMSDEELAELISHINCQQCLCRCGAILFN